MPRKIKNGFSALMVLLIVAVIIIAGGAIYYSKKNKPTTPKPVEKTGQETGQKPETTANPQTESMTGSGNTMIDKKETGTTTSPDEGMMKTEPQVKTFDVGGYNFAFSPTEIRVKKGDTVKINFESAEGFHDWTISGYNKATSRVSSGGKTSIEFTADQAGTFEFFCSVDGHRELGMTGKLIVE